MTPSQPGWAGKCPLTAENKWCALLSCHKNKGLFFPSDKAWGSQFLAETDQQLSAFLLHFFKTLTILTTQHFIAVSCAADLGHCCSLCPLTQPTRCSGVCLALTSSSLSGVSHLLSRASSLWVPPLTCLNISQMLILSKRMLIQSRCLSASWRGLLVAAVLSSLCSFPLAHVVATWSCW